MAALGREKAEEVEAVQVELVIAASVAQAYFALKASLAKQAYYQELVELYDSIMTLQRRIQENALFSKIPILETEENYYKYQKSLLAVEADVAINAHWINALVGVSPDCSLEVDPSLPCLQQTLALPCDLTLGLLARRPDLMVQIWLANALAHEVGAAIADFYPDISLTGFIGLESVKASRLFEPSSGTFGIKPALSLPIFTAGAIRSHVKARKALFDEAIFKYNELLLQSVQEVADLLASTQAIFYQKMKQDELLQSEENLYNLSLLRKENGLNNVLDTYFVKANLILKEIENVDILYNQYLAAVKLIRALGGGYVSQCGSFACEVGE